MAIVTQRVVVIVCLWTSTCLGQTGTENTRLSDSDLISHLLDRVETQNGLIDRLVTRVDALEARHSVMRDVADSLQRRVGVLETREKQAKKEATLMRTKVRKYQGVLNALDVTSVHRQGPSNKHSADEAPNNHNSTTPTSTAGLPGKTVQQATNSATNGAALSRSQTSAAGRVRRQAYRETGVAFFATLDDHLHHQGSDQPVVFERVITNIGNAYSNNVGDFRAPLAGTYVFSVTLMPYGQHTTNYKFTKNGNMLSQIILHSEDTPYTTVSQTIVVELDVNDAVSIRNSDSDASLHGLNFCIFSGFLQHELSIADPVIG